MRDVLDLPARGAQHDHVPHARLVDHLLVQLAHPAAARARGARTGPGLVLGAGQEHPEQPAVRDGAAGGDGQPLCAGTALQGPGLPVPHHAGPQLGELVRGVPPGEQVQHGLIGRVRQRGERGRTAHQVEPLLGVDLAQGAGGHGLLGQDVQRVRRDRERLDPPRQHPFHHHGRVHQVPAVFGEEEAPGGLADLVPGTPHALQPGGHRGRGLHLDDLLHGAHVDAQLQRARGHHTPQPPGLQVLLHQGPLLLGDRAVMGPRELLPGPLGARSGRLP